MSNKSLQLDLVDFVRFGWKRRKIIIGIALLAAVIAAVVMLFKKNTYQAYGSFFPASAVISGRVNMFREMNQEWIDIIGSEDEIDRLYVIGNGVNVVGALVEEFKMYDHYGFDTTDKNAMVKTFKKFTKNYNLSRSGFKHVEVSFTDEDPKLAAEIVNAAMNFTEKEIKKIYMNGHSQLAKALDKRSDSIQAEIELLTDTIVSMRTQYNIYDIISPGRKGLINGKMNGSGERFARGMEELQVVEELKDRLVVEKGKYAVLSNEFKTSLDYGIPFIHVAQWAAPSSQKAGPYRTFTVLGVFIGGILFSWLLVVLYEFFIRNKERFIGDV
jgi:hypothetical protein